MAAKAPAGKYQGSKFPFTEARLKAARKAVVDGAVELDSSGRRSWMDAECAGLRLTVNGGRGSSVFYFQCKVQGKTARNSIDDTDAVGLVEARETVRRMRYDRTVAAVLAPRSAGSGKRSDGADRTPAVKAGMDDMLAAHAAGRWLPGTRSKKPTDRTMLNYRNVRRAVMSDSESEEDFEQLSLQAFADRLPGIYAALQKRATIQANRVLQLWRNLFAFAARPISVLAADAPAHRRLLPSAMG